MSADDRYEATRPKTSEEELEEDVTKVPFLSLVHEAPLILDLLHIQDPHPTPPTYFRITQNLLSRPNTWTTSLLSPTRKSETIMYQ